MYLNSRSTIEYCANICPREKVQNQKKKKKKKNLRVSQIQYSISFYKGLFINMLQNFTFIVACKAFSGWNFIRFHIKPFQKFPHFLHTLSGVSPLNTLRVIGISNPPWDIGDLRYFGSLATAESSPPQSQKNFKNREISRGK